MRDLLRNLTLHNESDDISRSDLRNSPVAITTHDEFGHFAESDLWMWPERQICQYIKNHILVFPKLKMSGDIWWWDPWISAYRPDPTLFKDQSLAHPLQFHLVRSPSPQRSIFTLVTPILSLISGANFRKIPYPHELKHSKQGGSILGTLLKFTSFS